MSYAIELHNISKRFGLVLANDNVCLQIAPSSIHGIVGENGAGKSTLMSILYGLYQADSGVIKVFDTAFQFKHAHQAIEQGIGMVHQHFMLVDDFTVLENIILGAEGGALLAQSLVQARKKLNKLIFDYGLHVDIDATIDSLSVGLQQRVEILKALYRDAKILILDEPTGVLTPQETEELFTILNALKKQGVTIVLITHKLKEVMAITDRVSVMRQGTMVAHLDTHNTNESQLAEQMVGRKVVLQVHKNPAVANDIRLQVNKLSWYDAQQICRLHDISFGIKAGEIVGIAGVSGNGQSELLSLLTGILPIQTGNIEVMGTQFDKQHVFDAATMRRMGMAHVPEDRHKMGMVTNFSAAESAILGYHQDPEINKSLWLQPKRVKQRCQALMQSFDVRPPDPSLKSSNFSGGNQQKLILAREMERQPDILIIGQPTRGVDVGAIEFIHQRILAMRDMGKAILLVSVELEEILSLSDRILVLCDGHITGEVQADEADELSLGLLMANASSNAPSMHSGSSGQSL